VQSQILKALNTTRTTIKFLKSKMSEFIYGKNYVIKLIQICKIKDVKDVSMYLWKNIVTKLHKIF
jgi:hypothetical protein